ncbi:MAG: hypothetical protein JXX28_14290 [Deltaproteobacteria bacterium]|nr:hypothetical protein [Deltaproteobacteria bacterium]
MSWMKAVSLIVGAALVTTLALPTLTEAAQDRAPTKRDGVIEKLDVNQNGRLDKTEMKAFKQAHPVMHQSLVDFCKLAKKNPEAHGVKIGPDRKPKKVKCSKKEVFHPYLEAWAAQGAPVPSQHP